MVKKGATAGHRRSARISELEERARILAIQRQTKNFAGSNSLPPAACRKRGRKRKSLQAVVVNSVTSSLNGEGEDLDHDHSAAKSVLEQTENFSSLQWMPSKQTLEFILDILQRRDTQEIFAQPVDPKEVVGYYDIIKEPMDFGTMRAKLQETMYTSLDQFERDVFLISGNAMMFNSSNTVYYTEGCAIGELAKRLFHSLRNEQENFQLEYTGTRRGPDKKALGEAGGYAGVAKSGSLNDSSLKRTTQTHSRPYIGHMNNGYVSGSRDGRYLNSSETDRRSTYMPQTCCSEIQKIVSAVYKAPKSLAQVTSAGTFYVDSLMRFVKDLGPTARMIANKKLGKYPIESPKSLSWTPAHLGLTSDCSAAKPSALQNAAYLKRGLDSQMPNNFLSNPSTSYKGKMICTDAQMNFSWQDSVPNNNCHGVRPDATSSGIVDYTSQGEESADSGRKTGALGLCKEKTNGTGDNMDLLIAGLLQISNIQNRNNHAPSGKYYPLTGCEDLPPSHPSQNMHKSYTWLLNHAEPLSLPNTSTSNVVYPYGEGMNSASPAALHQNYVPKAVQPVGWKQMNRINAASTSLNHNYMANTVQSVGWKQPNGQGSSSAVPVALDHNYMGKSTQVVQPVGWKQMNRSTGLEQNYMAETAQPAVWKQPNGQGSSSAVPVALDHKYMAKSTQAVQPLGWKQINRSTASDHNYMAETVQPAGWRQPNGEGPSGAFPVVLDQNFMAKSTLSVQTVGWKQMNTSSAASTALDHNYAAKTIQPVGWKQPNGQGSSSAVAVALDQSYKAESTQAVQTVGWKQMNSIALDHNFMSETVNPAGWRQPNGEGPSSAVPVALDQNYMAKSTQAVQTVGWKQMNTSRAASTGLDHNYMAETVQPVGWKQRNGHGPSSAVPAALDQSYMAKSAPAVQTVGSNQPNSEGPSTAVPVALKQNKETLEGKEPNRAGPSTSLVVPSDQNFVAKTTQDVLKTGWKQPNGKGPSIPAPATSGEKNMGKSDAAVTREEWKQLMSWGLPAICDLPDLHTSVNDEMPIVEGLSQDASTEEIPLINTMNYLEGTNSQGDGRETNAQGFWYTQESCLTDKKLPDLDLQL